MRLKPVLMKVLRLGVIAGVFAFLFSSGRIELAELGRALLKPSFLALIALQGLLIVGNIQRWVLLVRAADETVPRARVWRAALRANFSTLLLPALGGSDVVRLANLGDARKTLIGGTLVADRAFALFGLAIGLVGSCAWVFLSGHAQLLAPVLRLAAVVIAGIACAPIGLVLAKRLIRDGQRPWLLAGRHVAEVALDGLKTRRTLGPSLVLSVASMVVSAVSYGFALEALGTAGLGASFVVSPLLTLAGVVPVTPQGIGVSEAAAEWLYGLVGLSGGAAAVVLLRLAWITATLLTGLAWLVEDRAPSSTT
jgi:uncharacterized membrane protein YbhN (UPF0104 family)